MGTPSRRRLTAVTLTAILVAAVVVGLIASHRTSAHDREHATAARGPLALSVSGTPTRRTIPSGFLGLSLEYPAVEAYAGKDPNAVNPVFEQLIRNLTPGQAPDLRIGGDSTDGTWWPAPHLHPPRRFKIAITPNCKTAMVANHNSPYGVTPISLANHHPGSRIKVGMAPEEIAITPNGRYAYVTNTTSDTVSVLDFPAGHAPHVIKTIRVGFSPEGISVTPNGKYAFVANNGSGTVSEIQISRDRVIHTIRTRGFPEAVAVTPNSKYAFVSDFTEQGDNWAADHTVTAITVATGAVRRQITVGHGPIALGATLDGLIVYVANWSSNTVTPIDVATATTAPAIGLAGQKEPVYIAIRP